MSKQIQLRRGTTAEHATFAGAVGEVTVDTTKDTLVVHDGATNGGYPLAKASDITNFIGLDDLSVTSGLTYSAGVFGADTDVLATKSFVTTTVNTAIAGKDNTDEITEGLNNLYFTTARARDAISVTDSGGDGSLSYANGVITYVGPSASDVRAHFTASTGISITNGAISVDSTVATKSYVDSNISTALATKDNTDEITEGSTNLYYTDARARNAISLTDASGDGSLTYNTLTGAFVYTGPSASEVRSHFTAGAGVTITAGEIAADTSVMATRSYVDTAVSSKDNTDEITEGVSNLYFTNTRARSAISVTDNGGDGSLSYDSGTGVISYTGPSASEVRAHFTAGNGITISTGEVAVDTTVIASKTYVDTAIAGKDNTDEITEGTTNLYYTNTRARASLSFSAGSGAYNSTTGVITIPTNTSQLANGAGFITASDNITGSAAKLTTARTLSISGDVTGSVSFDGSANADIVATIVANSVALGTDTTGNYVAGVTAGTGVSVSGAAGEGWSPTVAIGQSVGTTDNVTFNNLTLNGNLVVNGTTTTVSTSNLDIADPLIYLANGNTGNAVDIGFVGRFNDGLYQHSGLARKASADKWYLFSGMTTEPSTTITITDANFTIDTLVANIEGSVTGNASTATTLQTARTLSLSGGASGSVSFNGSANADISVTVADNSHNHTIANVTGLQTALDGKATKSALVTATTNSGSYALDVANYDTFAVTLGANTTVSISGSPLNHTTFTLVVIQDATGGRSITWPASFKFNGGIAPPQTTTANAVDVWSLFTYDGGSTYVVSLAVKDAK